RRSKRPRACGLAASTCGPYGRRRCRPGRRACASASAPPTTPIRSTGSSKPSPRSICRAPKPAEPVRDDAPFALDKAAVRRSFELGAARYDALAFLQREVGARLYERLDLMRIAPSLVADLGSGTGHFARLLEQRYSRARIAQIDLAPGMLATARSRQRRWRSRQLYVCADAERLPLRDAVADLVFSNMSLQWCPDLGRAFAECRRVLRPGGLLTFSTLGPDTLHELRQAWATIDLEPHVN